MYHSLDHQLAEKREILIGRRLDLDVRCVDEWSLWFDIRILLRTLTVPFQNGHATGQAIADIDDVNLCVDSTKVSA